MKNPCRLLIHRVIKKSLLLALASGIAFSAPSARAAVIAYYPFDTDALDHNAGNGQGLTLAFTSIGTTDKKFGSGAYKATASTSNTSVRRAQRSDGPGNGFDRAFTNFTCSIWAKADNWNNGANPERIVMGKWGVGSGGWQWRMTRNTTVVAIQINDAAGHDHTTFGTGNHTTENAAIFHHIAFTYTQDDVNNGTVRIYWNGKLETTDTFAMNAFYGANNAWFQIGNQGNSRNATAGRSFAGSFDDAIFYDTTLDDENIALIYGLGEFVGVAALDKYPTHADTQINEVLAAFFATGSAVAGGYTWSHNAGTGPATIGTISGSVAGGDAFIVLDPSGAGMKIGAQVDVATLTTALAGVFDVFPSIGDPDPSLTVTVPASMVATSAVSITITSSVPAVATPTGSIDGSVTVNFTLGGANTAAVPIHAVSGGTAVFYVTAATPTLLGANKVTVHVPALIGRWASGAADLVETSGFRPGQHDGYAVGANAGLLAFSPDVPLGFPGSSIDFTAGSVGVMVSNSATADLYYTNTYDDLVAFNSTVSFWAKGLPNPDWSPWVAKNGEGDNPSTGTGSTTAGHAAGDIGYQVRRASGSSHGTYTIRGTAGADDPEGNIDVGSTIWRHYAAVRDGVTGKRQLYVNGVLDTSVNLVNDFGAMGIASLSHLVLGGRDKNNTLENLYNGKLYDVRIYDGVLTPAQIQAVMAPTLGTITPGAVPLNVGDPDTATLTVYVPASLVATSTVSVTLASDAPTVANPLVTVVNFTQGGGSNTAQVLIDGGIAGTANITATSSQTTVAGTVIVSVTQPGLIGHWYSGAGDHVETSGFRPAGTHDGSVVGGTPGNQSFTSDVPAGFGGVSLALAGDVGVSVNNSSALDGAYQNTFDNVIQNNCTITFWAKGFPDNGWEPWISKQGEGNAWQVRKNGDSVHATFTVRGTAGNDDPEGVIDVSNGSEWRHYAAVWNGTYGFRKLYINGTSDAGNNLTDDFGPMGMELNAHVVFGGRDDNGYGNFSPMNLYDIRIYDNALSQYAVQQLMIPPPSLTIQRWTGNQVRISWPVSYPGYALQHVTALGAVWASAGLTVTVEGSENVAYAPASADERYYRLIK